MRIGYARVSTEDQNLALQVDALLKAGVELDFIFKEHRSGATTKRPELERCLQILRRGDTLVIWRLDRLGRSLKDLIALSDMFTQRGVDLVSLHDSIDTTTPGGRLVFQIMGAIAEFERNLISERTKAGLAASRKRGRMGGRKPKLSDQQIREGIDLLRLGKWNVSRLCRVYEIGRNTWYRNEKRYLTEQAAKIEKMKEAA